MRQGGEREPEPRAARRFTKGAHDARVHTRGRRGLKQMCMEEAEEARLRRVIAVGARAAARLDTSSTSAKLKQAAGRVAAGATAQHDLALLCSRQGRGSEADRLLRALGMRHRLSVSIFAPPSTATPSPAGLCGAPIVLDGVLPPAVIAGLQRALRPGAAFWEEHGYPTPCFFSYRHDLTASKPPLLLVEQAARLLQPLVERSRLALSKRESRPIRPRDLVTTRG